MSEQITPAQIAALQWPSKHEPAYLFPVAGPVTMTMIKRLVAKGLVERAAQGDSNFQFVRYGLSPAGRAVLDGTGGQK